MGDRWSELSHEAAQTIRAWAPIGLVSSPRLARVFGLTPQALKNWRWRGQGPAAEPCEAFGYAPTPRYYRVSTVLAWLDGRPGAEAWTYERDWLLSTFDGWRFGCASGDAIDVKAPLDERSTREVGNAIRAQGKEFETGLVGWPGPQPRRRPNLLMLAA